jgi:hypothetical protein
LKSAHNKTRAYNSLKETAEFLSHVFVLSPEYNFLAVETVEAALVTSQNLHVIYTIL